MRMLRPEHMDVSDPRLAGFRSPFSFYVTTPNTSVTTALGCPALESKKSNLWLHLSHVKGSDKVVSGKMVTSLKYCLTLTRDLGHRPSFSTALVMQGLFPDL